MIQVGRCATGPAGFVLKMGLLLALAGCSHGPRNLVSLPPTAPSALLIRNVSVLDVEAGEIVPAQDVLIRGEYISEIGPGDSIAGPPDTEVIDGTGMTLIPGLIDAHVHVFSSVGAPWRPRRPDPERNLESFLYCGVTTIFDTGSMGNGIFKLRSRVEEGRLLGPNIYASGRTVTAPGGHPIKLIETLAPWWIRWYVGPRIAHQIGTPEEARAAIAAAERDGVDFVKVVMDDLPGTAPRLDPAVLRAAVEAANERGLRTVAHIGTTRDAKTVGEAGVDAWIHGVYLERIPDEDIPVLAAFGIPMMPTTVVFDNAADLNRKPFTPTPLERQVAPAKVFEQLSESPDGSKLPDSMREWLDSLGELRPVWAENVARLHRAGVPMITGSDFQQGLFPGPSLHREIDLLGRAGIPPADVLRAATINPARLLSGSDDPEFGIIRIGKRADLVLVEGNPLNDLTALHEIRGVIVRGRKLVRTGYVEP
jgi:imidazolonepropionase-like amidohydrolase